jgi:hypothetical protein
MDFNFPKRLLLRVEVDTVDFVLKDVVNVDVGEAIKTTRVVHEKAFQSS